MIALFIDAFSSCEPLSTSLENALASDSEHPDRNDGAQRYDPAQGPAGCVEDVVVGGAAHRVGFRGCGSPVHGASPAQACPRRQRRPGLPVPRRENERPPVGGRSSVTQQSVATSKRQQATGLDGGQLVL